MTAMLTPASALAASYEALCGGTECTINVSSIGIRSPQGSIPPSRISYWSINGQSTTAVGVGVATTIIFGPLGLLGFLAKNENYNFTVDGYDTEGRRVAMQFKFKKKEPAKNITEEIMRISGLAMGRQRSIEEIQAIESGESPLNAMSGTVEPALSSMSKASLAGGIGDNNCGRVLQDYDCNYSAYLDANPSVKAWAESNPELAAQERARLGAYTDEEIEKRRNKTKTNSLGKMNPTYARDDNIKEQTTPVTMANRLGRLDPESGAAVNPKTHKLCLEARDYLGCVKAMDGYVPPNKSYSRNERESPDAIKKEKTNLRTNAILVRMVVVHR